MENTQKRLCVLFLIFGLGQVFCVTLKAGADHTFTPKVTGEIEAILWKYQSNKLVEYEAKDENWYRFKNRGVLYKDTGNLTLRGLTKDESGLYEAEIQVAGKIQNFRYDVKVIDPVSKPVVTCNANSSDVATLLCSVVEGDQAVFKWIGPNGLGGPGEKLDVPKNTDLDASFFCTAKNDVSEESIELAFKNCFPGDSEFNGAVVGTVLGVLAGILVIVGAIFGRYCWKRQRGQRQYETVAMEDGNKDLVNQNGGENEIPDKKNEIQNFKENVESAEDTADTLHQKPDSTGEGQSELLSVQNVNEEKKDQQDSTTEIAHSSPQYNSEVGPESIGGQQSLPPVTSVLDKSHQDKDDSSINVAKGAEVPQSEDKEKPESARENIENNTVLPTEATAKDEDNLSSNIGDEDKRMEAEDPPSNDEGKPESTREIDEGSPVVPTGETPAEYDDNASSNIGDEDESLEKQNSAGDGQTLTTPFKQPPTENNHPAPGTVGKRIEGYERFAPKPKVLTSRDADPEN